MINIPKKIGRVKIEYLGNFAKETYLDESEAFLMKFFDQPQSKKEKEIEELLSKGASWPIEYHLSPQRNLLLDWYPFRKNAKVLDIGAGCGALTGLLLKKTKKVFVNELTKKRAEVIARRYSDYNNLEIYVGSFLDLHLKERFDYITLIGVIEYSGKFISTEKNNFHDPFIILLKKVRKILAKDGHLLLAVENKLGLKYLAGGKEDHYGDLFSSIENYPNYTGIKTFSKKEIVNLLKKTGFSKLKFYYPFPDYKLPNSVLTDQGFCLNYSKSSYLQIIDLSNERIPIFNEIIFADNLYKENIISSFANSFLIDCQI